MNDAKDWLRKIPENAKRIVQALTSAGYEAVFVGGSVRDLLMGRNVHDFDIATSARPARVLELFPQAVPTGLPHGTVTVVKDGVPFEVTTYRVDLGYSDGRRPDAVEFSDSLVEDLKRRDFTINAMALRPTGELVDPFDGQADIARRTIRAVGDGVERFTEDSLRILRAIRFCAQLDFTIEEATKAAMHEAAPQLKNISTERIGQELFKIAQANWLMVLPELANPEYLGKLPTPFTQFRDSLEHLANTLCMHMHKAPILAAESPTSAGWRDFIMQLEQCLPMKDSALEIQDISVAALCAVALWVSSPFITEGEIRSLFRRLAWSKVFTREVLRVRQELLQIPSYQHRADWQNALFGKDASVIWIASALCDWLNSLQAANGLSKKIASDGLQSNGLQSECLPSNGHQSDGLQPEDYRRTCEAVYENMPIHRLKDLGVNGQILKEAGFLGPMIGKMLNELARAVLAGEVDNTPAHLLTYVKTYQGGRDQHE